MKKITLFLLTILISCSAWGAKIPAKTQLYLIPSGYWNQANARFAAYFFGNGETWVTMTNKDGIWTCESPNKEYTNVIFCRMNPSNTTNNWDNKWNQTSDLTYDEKNPIYVVKEDTWDKGGGEWKSFAVSGLNETWDDTNKMTRESDGSFTFSTLLENIQEFKIKAETSWNGSLGHKYVNQGDLSSDSKNNDNIKIQLDNKSHITITLSKDLSAITINYTDITNNLSNLDVATYGKLSYQLTMQEDRWYWISLPFDVKVSDIVTTGVNKNYTDLVFTEYDAQHRANGDNGLINWKTEYTDKGNPIPTQLQANKGYVIGPKTTKENEGNKFPGMTVTFPSVSATNTVAGSANLATTEATGENEKDNNWNIIGTGLYHEGSLSDDINYVAIPDNDGDYNYYYISSPIEDLKQLTSFAPFEAFFVQYGGPYSATANVATTSAELAPVARAKAQEQEQIYLINMNEAHTVVILNAEGSEGYTAGEDFLEMNIGSRIEMIYSFDAEDALAFNHRATEAQSIALGGYVAVAGEQTISLDAYNGNAEAVTLIDNVTGTTTDLLAEDYTFTAEVGSLDGRFTIVFAAQKADSDTTVDCYNSIANQVIAYGTADHCTVSGLTAGEAIVVYNTMGQLVFATTADSETITLPSLTAGNYLILHNGTTNKVTLR